jgi:hypothetical protein
LAVDLTVLAMGASTVLALATEALTNEALAVEALAERALAEEALAECLMLPAELSAMSRVTEYLAKADGCWLLLREGESCGRVVERIVASCVACADEAAFSDSKRCVCCCHWTMMSE